MIMLTSREPEKRPSAEELMKHELMNIWEEKTSPDEEITISCQS